MPYLSELSELSSHTSFACNITDNQMLMKLKFDRKRINSSPLRSRNNWNKVWKTLPVIQENSIGHFRLHFRFTQTLKWRFGYLWQNCTPHLRKKFLCRPRSFSSFCGCFSKGITLETFLLKWCTTDIHIAYSFLVYAQTKSNLDRAAKPFRSSKEFLGFIFNPLLTPK